MKYYIIFISVLILSGCEKENYVNTLPNDDTTNNSSYFVDVFWQTKLNQDVSYSRSLDPILTPNGLITSTFQGSKNEIINKFDLSSGDLIWSWSDFVNPNPGQRVLGHDKTFIVDNILFADSDQDSYGININSGESEWYTYLEDGDPHSSSSNGLIFQPVTYRNGVKSDSSSLFMLANSDSGNWKEVYKVRKEDDFEKRLIPPISFLNNMGDTLLLFHTRQIVRSPYQIKVDLHCYNMTQGWMEWEHLEFDQWGNSNARAPLIDGDYCYFVGLASVYCFNIHTGEKVWQYDHDVAWQLSNYLIHENNFIIKDDQSNLLAINKNNGQLSWKNEDASGCCVTMRLYDDRIYFANSGLFIVDARNGKMLYRDMESPNKEEYPGAAFKNTVAVDLEQKIMYATDGYFVMAMELPE